MNTIKLTDKELYYMRYLVKIHGGTEEFPSEKEKQATYKIVDSIAKKLGVL